MPTTHRPDLAPRPTIPDGERGLRTAEVAGKLHVSPKTVSRWAAEGKLPFIRTLGGHRRYPEGAINALVEELTTRPEAQ